MTFWVVSTIRSVRYIIFEEKGFEKQPFESKLFRPQIELKTKMSKPSAALYLSPPELKKTLRHKFNLGVKKAKYVKTGKKISFLESSV